MRTITFVAAALCLAAAAADPTLASDLPRRASLGIRVTPAPQGVGGALAAQVMHGSSAEAMGLHDGDLIVRAGGHAVTQASDVTAYAHSLHGGDQAELTVTRAGHQLRLHGKAKPRPYEQYENATSDYGAVAFRGGQLRDILVTPKGISNPPVLFLLPGFSCASIEPADASDPYRRLGEELVKRGVAYYRVEKPGLGDSAGTPDCADIDFATELEAFRDAYRHLIEARQVNPDRIFMFGHSLGGLEAPLLAAETPPRGIAVYGTVLRNWADYHFDVDRIQSFLANGADVAQAAEASESHRDLLRSFYFAREAPEQIAEASSAYGDVMRNAFGWNGTDKMFGRNYKFMQDLAHLPLSSAWKSAKSRVLALYGESDIVAIDDRDHKLIADIADFYRPGSGRFVQVARTGHGMTLVGNRQDYREKAIATGDTPDGPFNPEIATILAEWVKTSMREPPVRLRKDREVAAPAAR